MQLTRDGKTLTYEVTGQGADTVIFIPALGTTREMWRGQVPAFSSDYTVVTYDAAGHDPDAAGSSASLDDYAADLLALADEVAARRPHVVGLSLGGMIAQAYGARYPDRAKSFVLACTTSSYPEQQRQQMRQRADTAARDGMGGLVEPTIERWFTRDFVERQPETVQRFRQMLASADPTAYAAAARVVAAVDTTGQLPRIAAPVLALSGERDTSMPANAVSVLTSHLRNARSTVITGAAHLANVEGAEQFNDAVLGFIRAIDNATPGEAGVPGMPRHGNESPLPGPAS